MSKLLKALICFIAFGALGATAAEAEAAVKFERITLPSSREFKEASLGLTNCKSAFDYRPNIVLALCDDPRNSSKTNFGTRLLLIDTAQSRPTIIFRAPSGGGDAYSAKLSVFEIESRHLPRVLLLDYGAEFHFGTMVFFQLNDKLKYVGEIRWVALSDDNQLASPTGFAEISGNATGFRIDFSQKLFLPTHDGSIGNARFVSFSYDSAAGKLVAKTRD